MTASVARASHCGSFRTSASVAAAKYFAPFAAGSESLRGYVSAHVGAMHFSSYGYGDDTKFSFDIGTGVKAFLTKNIYLRADLRGICVLTEAQGSFIYANGVTVASFSGSTLWQGQVSAGVGFTF